MELVCWRSREERPIPRTRGSQATSTSTAYSAFCVFKQHSKCKNHSYLTGCTTADQISSVGCSLPVPGLKPFGITEHFSHFLSGTDDLSEWVFVGNPIYGLKDSLINVPCCNLCYFCKLILEVMTYRSDIARNFRSFMAVLWIFKLPRIISSSNINIVLFKAMTPGLKGAVSRE